MMLDKRRLRICAGVFCLAAAFGSREADAAQVYPGCAVPPTTFKHIWYIDPVNGKTAAAGGLGTQAAPWNSLQAAFSPEPGYTAPLLSTAPYRHPNPADPTNTFYPGGGPIQPGDQILLMSGNYGDVSIGGWNSGVNNPSFVTIAAAPGQTPVFSTLATSGSSYFAFSGIKVESLKDPAAARNARALILVSGSPAFPSSNMVFTDMIIASADNTSDWTQAQWVAQAREGGIYAYSGAGATCVSVTNSHIFNVIFGSNVMANNMLFAGNEIDHFGDDGIDYGASNIQISKNYIHDDLELGFGAHMDGMQGYPGVFKNVVIDSNRVIRQADPKLPFPGYLQGIDAFNGDWENFSITNNVVVTSACWGMVFASLHGSRIINNTVISDGWPQMAGKCKPRIFVGDKTHEGSSSNDVIMRNNLANGLGIYASNPGMAMDHNLCAEAEGKCDILPIINGKPQWGMNKPGVYADHNIIGGGNEGEFVNYDPAKFVFDLRLKAGARAIGTGSPDGAPTVDITGAARGNSVDIGAYRYNPAK